MRKAKNSVIRKNLVFPELVGLLQHRTAALDVLYVLEGVKPASRVVVAEPILESVKDFCLKVGLSCETSDFKVLQERGVGKGNFTNTGKTVPLESKQEGGVYVYISKDEDKAGLAKMYEGDARFGEALGYPRCCIDFFQRNYDKQSKKQNDFILPSIKKFGTYPFYNNYALRYFDISLINHFPCFLDCKKSEEIGRRNLEVIRKYSPEIADFFVRELKSVVIYTEYDGVFYSSDYKLEGNKIIIGDVKGTVENWLFRLLKEKREILVKDYNNFTIGDKEMKGDNVGIMIFS